MLSQLLDVTNELNANHFVQLDIGEWNTCTIQVTGSISGTIDIKGSNDGGAIQGVTDGNAISAKNFTTITIQAARLSDGSAVTTLDTADNYSFQVMDKYLYIGGTNAATTGSVLIQLNTVR